MARQLARGTPTAVTSVMARATGDIVPASARYTNLCRRFSPRWLG